MSRLYRHPVHSACFANSVGEILPSHPVRQWTPGDEIRHAATNATVRLLHTQLSVRDHEPLDGEQKHLYEKDVVIRMQVEVHIPVESTASVSPMFSVHTKL